MKLREKRPSLPSAPVASPKPKARRKPSESGAPRMSGDAVLQFLRDGLAGMDAAHGDPHALARAGTQGAGQPLPHLAQIQRSFGAHDVTTVVAHTDGDAQDSARAMGAAAYAYGNHAAFAGAPSLRTAAHEAAHVVQQRVGLSLPGGAGRRGDLHEQHADAVADHVVAGRSSEHLLNLYAPAYRKARQTDEGGVVQRDDRADLAAVKSLEVEDELTGALGGQWSQLGKKLKERHKEVVDLLKHIASKADDIKALEAMRDRWDAVIDAMAKHSDETATPGLIGNARVLLAADRKSLGGLHVSAKFTKNLTQILNDIDADLSGVEQAGTTLSEERVEFKRLDSAFLDPDVVAALHHAKFTPAELKAMLAQETGDFTDTSIAGLEGKTQGVHRPIPKTKKTSVIGVAQLKPSSVGKEATMPDVRKEADKLKIELPAEGKDPTKDPALVVPAASIKSAALYVAFIFDLYRSHFPGPHREDDELKLFIVAGYNNGPFGVRGMAQRFANKHAGQKFEWKHIAVDETIQAPNKAETVIYVERFLRRLGRP